MAKKDSTRRREKASSRNRHPVTGCRADTLMGLWLMDADILDGYRAAVDGQDLVALKRMSADVPPVKCETVTVVGTGENGVPSKSAKVAVIGTNGPMTKYPTSMQAMTGGTSTMMASKAIMEAVANPEIGSILLAMDTPGGTAHGAFDYADVIRKAAGKKPVIAFGSGMVCSAGMLAASQASRFIATPETEVGSIGVKAILRDTSKMLDNAGVKVIPVAVGKHKVGYEPGTPVTDDVVASVQKDIEEINSMFLSYVARGRGGSPDDYAKLEAGTFRGQQAIKHRLIDEIGDSERAFDIAFDAAQNPEKYLVKSGKPEERGPVLVEKDPKTAPTTEADSPVRSNRIMLTPEQLAQAKRLPGAENITAENADTVLLGVAMTLFASTQPVPKALADRHVSIAHREISLLQKEGKLTPEQTTALKGIVTEKNVGPDGSINVSLDDVQKVLATNKPSGLLNNVTGDQPQQRDVPGSGDNKPTPEQIRAKAAQEGLAYQNSRLGVPVAAK